METKHAPETWETSKDAVPQGHVQITVYDTKSGKRVATVFEREANAHLIAASPDMRAALQAAKDQLDWFVRMYATANTIKPASAALEAARAALAKANGG